MSEFDIFAGMNTTLGNRAALVRSVFLILITFWLFPALLAQVPNDKVRSKIAPALSEFLNRHKQDTLIRLQVITTNTIQFTDSLQSLEGVILLDEYKPLRLLIFSSPARWVNRIAGWQCTVFTDLVRTAQPELFTGTMDGSVNGLNQVWARYPLLNGSTSAIGIKENSFDTTDIDYRGRVLINPAASPANNSHATIMSTIAAGAGNTWYAARGAAWGSHIVSSPFTSLLPDPASFFQNYGVSVQNHSYGTGIENYYGVEALAYDQQVSTSNDLVHVFSAGNSGNSVSTSGTYAGVPGFANLTGQFKMAKNIITVGATDSFHVVGPASSRGPAYDGRIKPELVALGEDGSSGSAALTSGVVAVLQDAYRSISGGNLPPASLVKALLVNTADDIGVTGPDYQSGFGTLNTARCLDNLISGNYVLSSVQSLQEQTINLVIPAGCRRIKITLAWTDPPAPVNAGRALVNDLDLELDFPAGMQTWFPWVLSAFPHPDSLAQPARRSRDTLNNLEQITVDLPAAGNYVIRVKGARVVTAQQAFSLAWQMEENNHFDWNYPMKDDPLLGGEANVLRWRSTLAVSTGTLQYSLDEGITWLDIHPSADLTRGYYKWNAPALFSKCLLRMIAGNSYETDTVVISNRLGLSAGFNCTDSFQLHWPRISGANLYHVYRLGSRYMEHLSFVTDTTIVMQKLSNPSLYYAVAPVTGGREGVKSYATNYTLQGLQCYFRSFYADQFAGVARVQLQLGSLYNIRRIILVKYTGRDSVILQSISNPVSLSYTFYDPGLRTGATSYRVYLETVNGNRLASELVTILYSAEERIFVYPNPVRSGQPFAVLLNDNQNGELHLMDASGRLIRVIAFAGGGVLELETSNLSPGVYLLQVKGHARSVKAAKLVVY